MIQENENEERYQFSFEVLWNDFQCEATASISAQIINPQIDDIVIESLGVKEDAAITSEDVDAETLKFFKEEALRSLKKRQ